MWEMFDDDIECDECGGPGPPPKFLVPPPPRPPFMQELVKCPDEENINLGSDIFYNKISDNSNSNNNIMSSNNNMCEAIPILDPSYHSSPSLQTPVMIAVFSLLLVLIVLISSLFVWKHKRKVQNFLPCKSPARGGHLSGGVPSPHAVTYEDPDAQLGHTPLVMRHHHNVEMIHPKSIHYPSGYPMTRSPPLFVCSSPGPDPYRSHDNVYEELGPASRESDNESEPPLNSDDDFAEDELSLPGERSFQKCPSDTTSSTTAPVATIYHERRSNSTTGTATSASGQERNSLLSSSSSTSTSMFSKNQQQQQQQGYHQHRQQQQQQQQKRTGSGSNTASSILSGVFRLQANGCGLGIGRKTHHSLSNNGSGSSSSSKINFNLRKRQQHQQNSSEPAVSDIVPTLYDERNLLSFPYNSHNLSTNNNGLNISNNNNNNLSTGNSNHNNINNNNHSSNNSSHFAGNLVANTPAVINNNRYASAGILLDSEVERRNRINQLHHTPSPLLPTSVSTIYRGERTNFNTSRYPQPYYSQHSLLNGTNVNFSTILGTSTTGQRSRTNPRSLDRRRMIIPIDHESNYGYAEPVFHEGLLYDGCLAHPNNNNNTNTNSNMIRTVGTSGAVSSIAANTATISHSYPYVVTDYTTAYNSRTLGNSSSGANNSHHHYYYPHELLQPKQQHHYRQQNQQQQHQLQYPQHPQQQIYSRDSSFGSDSGYSHHTQTSSNRSATNSCNGGNANSNGGKATTNGIYLGNESNEGKRISNCNTTTASSSSYTNSIHGVNGSKINSETETNSEDAVTTVAAAASVISTVSDGTTDSLLNPNKILSSYLQIGTNNETGKSNSNFGWNKRPNSVSKAANSICSTIESSVNNKSDLKSTGNTSLHTDNATNITKLGGINNNNNNNASKSTANNMSNSINNNSSPLEINISSDPINNTNSINEYKNS